MGWKFKLKDCDCNHWKIGMTELNNVISIAYVHDIIYEAPPFIYCPWCGKHREVISYEE